jgi:predicted permease
MLHLIYDVRYALRMLLKSPGFTAAAVLTLALGIAANTTVFGWIDAVLLRPLPGVSEGHRLAVVEIETTGWNNGTVNFSYGDYRVARDNLKLLSGIALFRTTVFNLGDGKNARRVYGELVSGNYFAVLGVKPLLGRVFLPEEYGDKPGAYPVAVISERLWRNRFNADPGVIGKAVHVNQRDLTIVGVVPAEFHGTQTAIAFEMWVPLMMTPQLTRSASGRFDQGSRDYWTIARLQPGATIEQARAEIVALVRRLSEMNPRISEQGLSASVVPVWRFHNGAQVLLLAPLRILMAVSFVVLLIVCANVANLLLSRSIARQKEFSIRVALGAGRGRLARQLLTEAMLLAVMGALAGLLFAQGMAKSLVWLLPPASLPVSSDLKLNGDIVVFTILICAAAALVSGMAPVLHAIRPDVNEALKEGGRSGMSGTRSHRMRGLLVVSEVALALVALIGAALFVRSFQTTRAIHPGFDAQNVSVAQIDLSTSGYLPEQGQLFCVRLRERLKSAPGVVDVAYSDRLPLGFGLSPWQDIEVEGYAQGRGENMKIYYHAVSPGFFNLMRIPQVDGRDFTEHDDLKTAPVMIVNESFVRRFSANRNPIGRKVRFWGQWFTVAGVVKDAKYHSLTEAPQPFIYVPQVYSNDASIAFQVRSAGNSNDALAALRREVAAIDPNVPVFDAMPLSEYMSGSLFAQKVAASLLSALGGMSLLLAAVGLYSVMAYTVGQRTHEIGIRMAVGARPRDVLRMVVRQGMVLTVTGLVAGIAVALAAARLVGGMLVDVSANDPTIFAGVAVFLASVAFCACYLPARRATRVDPIVALHCQ